MSYFSVNSIKKNIFSIQLCKFLISFHIYQTIPFKSIGKFPTLKSHGISALLPTLFIIVSAKYKCQNLRKMKMWLKVVCGRDLSSKIHSFLPILAWRHINCSLKVTCGTRMTPPQHGLAPSDTTPPADTGPAGSDPNGRPEKWTPGHPQSNSTAECTLLHCTPKCAEAYKTKCLWIKW